MLCLTLKKQNNTTEKKPSPVKPVEKDLRVQPIGLKPEDRLRFLVESEHEIVLENETWQDHAHAVNLGDFQIGPDFFNGSCSCGHFEFRLAPQAGRGVSARCHHIKAALIYLADIWVPKWIEKQK